MTTALAPGFSVWDLVGFLCVVVLVGVIAVGTCIGGRQFLQQARKCLDSFEAWREERAARKAMGEEDTLSGLTLGQLRKMRDTMLEAAETGADVVEMTADALQMVADGASHGGADDEGDPVHDEASATMEVGSPAALRLASGLRRATEAIGTIVEAASDA